MTESASKAGDCFTHCHCWGCMKRIAELGKVLLRIHIPCWPLSFNNATAGRILSTAGSMVLQGSCKSPPWRFQFLFACSTKLQPWIYVEAAALIRPAGVTSASHGIKFTKDVIGLKPAGEIMLLQQQHACNVGACT